ncbi:MAG: hypothetical protein FWC64_13340 [Treponema sp.]|nr:hypothetical protein [Treponema sp.]
MNRKNAPLSPLAVFLIYILASAVAVMAFRFIFPGESAPLSYFSLSWRLIRGALDVLSLFPALALCALVIPFGFTMRRKEAMTSFSPHFFQSLKMSIVTAIVAASLYGLLFFLALPLARDYEAGLRYQGQLYQLAREQAQEHALRGEWLQTAQFLAICERIWPGGYQVASLAAETANRLEERWRWDEPLPVFDMMAGEFQPDLPGQTPLANAAEALARAETALAQERLFDAHWLAAVASRLAAPNSPEAAAALRLASIAWDRVNSLAPNAQELRAFSAFRLKLEGYQALSAGEWIRAYHIFLELLEITPADPDVHRFFAMSAEGLRQVAFFIDEIDIVLGTLLTGAVFSLPADSGRIVMRFASVSMFPDAAYCMGAEILALGRDGSLLWSMQAPYAKIMPLALNTGPPRVVVLLRALDRTDPALSWEPAATGFGQSPPDTAQIVLPVSWNDFVLLSNARRGLSTLSTADLRRAAENLGALGYKPQVFQVELIRRFAEPLLLLLLGIAAIALGWRYRALKPPGFMGVLMLGIMPVVFNIAVNFFRGWINNLGILAVLSVGFTTAAFFFAAAASVLFIVFLIALASQNS